MVDVLEFRINKLARMSDHYRHLAAALIAEKVSAEIAAVADAFDDEVVRMNRECAGRRVCPCQFRGSCVAPDCADPSFGPLSTKNAAWKIN